MLFSLNQFRVITLNLPEILSELKETPKSLLTYVIENYEEFSSEDSLAIRAALANYIAESIDVENDLMDLLDNTENVISIAAAGNFNNEDPEEFPFELIDANNNDVRDAFAPAAWESVLAVSGSLGDNPNAFWSASNDGQVQAPAAWIHFDTPSDLDSYGSGTSFATPLVTAHVVNAIQNNCSQVFTLWQLFGGDNLYFKNAINSRCP